MSDTHGHHCRTWKQGVSVLLHKTKCKQKSKQQKILSIRSAELLLIDMELKLTLQCGMHVVSCDGISLVDTA